MTPTVGRIVLVYGSAARSNGAECAPGIITRVWSDTTVNLTVFRDAAQPQQATSAKFVESPPEDPASIDANVWCWPPRS